MWDVIYPMKENDLNVKTVNFVKLSLVSRYTRIQIYKTVARPTLSYVVNHGQ
jgi:hypothetical protein